MVDVEEAVEGIMVELGGCVPWCREREEPWLVGEEQQEWKEFCGEMYGEERLDVAAVKKELGEEGPESCEISYGELAVSSER